jgi:hypothetical protein
MIEVPRWRKSSRSNGAGGACVEVADNIVGRVLVRDTKDCHGATLTFGQTAWRSFVESVKR